MRLHTKPFAEQADVDMTPMLDVVFILLIFFVVTSSFIREHSVALDRPSQSASPDPGKSPIFHLRIDEQGQYWIRQRSVDERLLLAEFQQAQAEQPDLGLLIEAHHSTSTQSLIAAVDAAKGTGITNVKVAAYKE